MGQIVPSNSSLFPWLGTLAPLFEKYRFRKLEFEFVPVCATTVAGQVGLAVEYDTYDPNPSTFQEFLANDNCVVGSVWTPFTLRATRLGAVPVLFNTLAYPTGSDLKSYICGNLLACSNYVTAGLCGYVKVHYTVDMLIPQPSNHLSNQDGQFLSTINSLTNSTPLGQVLGLTGNVQTAGEGIATYVSGVLSFLKAGYYLITSDLKTTTNNVAAEGPFVSAATVGNGASASTDPDYPVQANVSVAGQPSETLGQWLVSAPVGGTVQLFLTALVVGLSYVGHIRIARYKGTDTGLLGNMHDPKLVYPGSSGPAPST
jgi:hypothetical protein